MALLLRSIAPDFRSYYDPAKALELARKGTEIRTRNRLFQPIEDGFSLSDTILEPSPQT
jgi:hypothetical protein